MEKDEYEQMVRLADQIREERVGKSLSDLVDEYMDTLLLLSILIDRDGGEVRISDEELVSAERKLIMVYRPEETPHETVIKTVKETIPPYRRNPVKTRRSLFTR